MLLTRRDSASVSDLSELHVGYLVIFSVKMMNPYTLRYDKPELKPYLHRCITC